MEQIKAQVEASIAVKQALLADGALLQQIESADPIPVHLRELLRALVERTGETAVLAAASSAYAVFLDVVESPHAIRYNASPGKLVPLHVTATGRALLSHMTPADRSAVLRRANFERYTPSTLMSVAAVEKEIQRSLERGWFEGNAEFTLDLGGVALPLKMQNRQFVKLQIIISSYTNKKRNKKNLKRML